MILNKDGYDQGSQSKVEEILKKILIFLLNTKRLFWQLDNT